MVRRTLHVSVLFLGQNIRFLREKPSVKGQVKINHIAKDKFSKLILSPLIEGLQYQKKTLFG